MGVVGWGGGEGVGQPACSPTQAYTFLKAHHREDARMHARTYTHPYLDLLLDGRHPRAVQRIGHARRPAHAAAPNHLFCVRPLQLQGCVCV